MYTPIIRNPKSRKFLGEVLNYGTTGTVTTSPVQDAANQEAARDTYLVKQLHALAIAIYQAKQRNDKVGVENLLVHFRRLADEYRERGSIGVSPFDKILLETEEWLRKAGSAVGSAVSEIGWSSAKALLPFAVIAGGLLYFKGKLL